MFKYYFLFFTVIFAVACVPNIKEKTASFSILEGKWAVKATNSFVEEWQKQSDSLFVGKSYIQKGDSIIPMESMKLVFRKDSVFYVPIVFNQNEGKPVSFYLSHKNDSLFLFENPKHDFPQRIIYAFSGKNKLLVTIDGKINGAYHKEDFSFTKE